MTRNVEQLLIYVVSVCVSSSEKCLLICLYNFEVILFFHFRALCAHNNSDRRPLSNTWLGKRFPSAVLFLTCLMESLDEQKLKFFIFVIYRLLFSSLAHSFKIESKDFTDKFKVVNILFFVLLKELCGFISYVSVFDPFLCCSFLVDLFSWCEAGAQLHYFSLCWHWLLNVCYASPLTPLVLRAYKLIIFVHQFNFFTNTGLPGLFFSLSQLRYIDTFLEFAHIFCNQICWHMISYIFSLF